MKISLLLSIALLLAACGGGEAVPPSKVDDAVQGSFVLRVQHTKTGYVALEEAPAPYHGGPPSAAIQRRIRTAGGDVYVPPEGWSLIDMVRHPSGAVSAVLASPRELRLVRMDERARKVSETPLTDSEAVHDPYYGEGGIKDDFSLLPLHTRDAVRLAALGEDLAVALRTGRHAVVAYRYAHGVQGYVPLWRRLVEPGTALMSRHLTSGSYDTYGQLINHLQVLLATNARGDIAVAVPAVPYNGAFAAHAAHFLIPIPLDPRPTPVLPDYGAIVTRLDGNGHNLGASFVDTGGPTQVYGLRALPNEGGGGWAIVGRHKVAGQDGGWNGFSVWLNSAGRLQRHVVLDVDEDDVLFDIAALPDGRHLVAGATGYRQNPAGASISDQSAPLLAVLDAQGRIVRRWALPIAAGQNTVHSLDGEGSRWVAAGMRGGPGTHTADLDPARMRADGYVLEVDAP